jgi:ABC-type antimicrobial peptide transport system permease subunit
MDSLIQNVRYALTTMRRNKGFATAGLLTLALGIGATTAVFSVVYGVLLRPLPYPDADRLVELSEEHPGAVTARFMRSVLFGVAPLDVTSFVAAPVVLALVAALACLLPARRAASTDPAEALRCE